MHLPSSHCKVRKDQIQLLKLPVDYVVTAPASPQSTMASFSWAKKTCVPWQKKLLIREEGKNVKRHRRVVGNKGAVTELLWMIPSEYDTFHVTTMHMQRRNLRKKAPGHLRSLFTRYNPQVKMTQPKDQCVQVNPRDPQLARRVKLIKLSPTERRVFLPSIKNLTFFNV